jgi:hypothetical protein
MQKYTFEPIPEGMVLLFRETDEDPYWCQICEKQIKSKTAALAHGRKTHKDTGDNVKTVTGQKPVCQEAKLARRQAYLKDYYRLNVKQQVGLLRLWLEYGVVGRLSAPTK